MTAIGVIGDPDPGNETHLATMDALGHAAMALGGGVDVTWLPTDEIDVHAADLAEFSGLLVAPGSPYRSMEGALAAIEYARTQDVPLLGTCAGLQHVVVEFARNVLGVDDAHHAEYDPAAPTPFVTPLVCSLAGQTLDIEIRSGSRAADAYGAARATERYYCDFGPNPEYLDDLVAAGLHVSGTDEGGEVCVLELPDLRFYLAALFVPQVDSTLVRPHPLVCAFVGAAMATSTG